jgi:hypothetical protein
MNRRYSQIIYHLCKKHGIICEKVFDTDEGLAYISQRRIRIPKKIDSVLKFMTSLHEIGHIVNGKKRHRFYEEYLSEKYAIETARKYNIKSNKYVKTSKIYIRYYLSVAWNKGLKHQNIPKEVEKFIGINLKNLIKIHGNKFKFGLEGRRQYVKFY